MAVELATAYIALVPSLKGANAAITRELSGVDTTPAGEAMGRKAGSGLLSSLKGFVAPAAAILGGGMFAGFIKDAAAASDATDKFVSTMSFAGMDTSAIEAAKNAAKSYADQTVYDLPTIQNMTAQLASNGVKDYTGLTQAAGNLNAVAGGNAETFKSVAMVMTQTAGAGKLTTENWNQMADAIPGAAGPLMKAMEDAGAYTGNFRDAMAAGQITSDEFNEALQKLGTDPVAVEAAKSTKTFEGAIGGLQATINSGLMSALNAMKPAITGAINMLSGGLGKAFEWTGNAAKGLHDLFVKGDFGAAFRNAFHVEEDSGAVKFLFTIRDGVLAAKAAFSGEGITSNGFVGVMERIGVGLREGVGGVRAFFAAFKAGDGDVTSSGFAGFLEGLGGKARALADQIGPILSQVFAAVGPVLGQIGAVIRPLIPQFMSLWSSVSPIQTIFQAIQPLLPQILGVFGQLASVIGGALGTALTTLLPVFSQLQGVFVSVFSQVLATALPVIVQLVTMLGQTFSQLIPIVVPIITQIATLAMTLVSQLAPILMQLISAVMPMVVTIFGAVAQAIGPLIQMIAGLLIPIIQALMPVVVTVFGVIANIITSVMQIIMGIIQVVTGIISGNWDQVWTGIMNIFGGIWNTIVAVLSGVLQIIGQVVMSGLGFIGGFIGDVLGNIGRFFSDTWNNIINGVSGFINGFLKFFNDLPGNIMNALAGAGKWLLDVGKNIVQGLLDGIKSMGSAVLDMFLNILPEAIRGPIKTALGIASPSKVFRVFGRNLGEGLILGAEDTKTDIESTIRGLVTVPNVPSFGASGFTAASGRSSSVVNNITINQVDDPIGTSHALQRRMQALAT